MLDLPQLYQKPSGSLLLTTLSQLTVKPSSWDAANDGNRSSPSINEEGIPAYLTRIIMSHLDWLSSQDEREDIWEAASKRLAERSGRTVMPSVSRVFTIPTLSMIEGAPKTIDITIYEPSLTGDNLGHKTWVASYLLAKRLPTLLAHHYTSDTTRSPPVIAQTDDSRVRRATESPPISSPTRNTRPRLLELGAGTGLVGLTASALLSADIHLTDLPAIVLNLEHNIQSNSALWHLSNSHITSSVLDWSSTHPILEEVDKYDIILAADSLYAPEHAKWLAATMAVYLQKSTVSGMIFVELPFRSGQPPEHEQFRYEMSSHEFQLVEEGEETGFDDWESNISSERVEVRCWWSVWRWCHCRE